MISIVSGGAARADFEASQLMLTEHIYMLTERSKFSSRIFLATYAARGNQPGRGDHWEVGHGGYGGCGGGVDMLNGE